MTKMNERAKELGKYINFRRTMPEHEALSQLSDLISRCQAANITVEFKDRDVLYDYDGMNWVTAERWGFIMSDRTIYLSKHDPAEKKLRTLRHEIREIRKSKEGWKYWPAHKFAETKEMEDVSLRGL